MVLKPQENLTPGVDFIRRKGRLVFSLTILFFARSAALREIIYCFESKITSHILAQVC
jgi:hypothetical protein